MISSCLGQVALSKNAGGCRNVFKSEIKGTCRRACAFSVSL
jgi:hypothetical protein